LNSTATGSIAHVLFSSPEEPLAIVLSSLYTPNEERLKAGDTVEFSTGSKFVSWVHKTESYINIDWTGEKATVRKNIAKKNKPYFR